MTAQSTPVTSHSQNGVNGSSNHGMTIPEITPLQRLAVHNGLLLDAERWQVAHNYHRQRQNLHYQALHLPGIVCGLTVAVIAAPAEVSPRYRDQRWLEVSSGLAIDSLGNLIVIDHPVNFHLASVVEGQPHWVYLVARYVDPEALQRSHPSEIVAETFRIDERKRPPDALEVEICRILLPPGEVALSPAVDVFAPGLGELDMRHRVPARLRPQATVRVAFATTGLPHEDRRIRANLASLLATTNTFYPALTGDRDIIPMTFSNTVMANGTTQNDNSPSPNGNGTAQNGSGTAQTRNDTPQNGNGRVSASLTGCDLLYLNHRQCLDLPASANPLLQQFLAQGGVMLVELPSRDGNFEELTAIAHELANAIADLQGSHRFSDLRDQLKDQHLAISDNLKTRLSAVQKSLIDKLTRSGIEGITLAEPDVDHPLRHSPFNFSQWPILRSDPLRIFAGGGIVFALGDLSAAWAAPPDMTLPRERVRSAQELGINILNFAWQRHHRTQAQTSKP
ncbi:MAG: hypothetical protein AAFY20_04030 [Cyanobacteria bacterium J06639_14]